MKDDSSSFYPPLHCTPPPQSCLLSASFLETWQPLLGPELQNVKSFRWRQIEISTTIKSAFVLATLYTDIYAASMTFCNSCLVCHTLHIRTCNPAPVIQTFNFRAPRKASATSSETSTLSMQSGKLQSSHQKVHQNQPFHLDTDEAEPVSSECEPGCGEGGTRTICKIRYIVMFWSPFRSNQILSNGR